MRSVFLFDVFVNPGFRVRACFANVPIFNFYTSRYFKSSGTGSLNEKQFLILNKPRTSLMLKLSLQDCLTPTGQKGFMFP